MCALLVTEHEIEVLLLISRRLLLGYARAVVLKMSKLVVHVQTGIALVQARTPAAYIHVSS